MASNKTRFILLLSAVMTAIVIMVPTLSMASQPTVDLGTASGFAILAGDTIANLGATSINGSAGGNVGLFPGTGISGQSTMSLTGTIHLNDAVASQAKNDLLAAYGDADGRTPVTRVPSQLGGATLTPGTYDSEDGQFRITGTLTLDAQGDPDAIFIFKTSTNLLTDADSMVNLINGAQPCRVFWKVGSQGAGPALGVAALGTNSHFEGNILAQVSIRVSKGTTVQGRLLALIGSVTLNNNTITADVCPPEPTLAKLTVIKHVINDDGGTANAGDFNLHVKMVEGNEVENSPAPGVEAPGTTYTLPPGTYVVSEDEVAGYTASYTGDGDSGGQITLSPGDNKTVTITNDDNKWKKIPSPAILSVVKHVINANGGTAAAGDFSIHVRTLDGSEVENSPAPGVEAPGTTYTLPPGTYVVSEDEVAGYTASYSGDSDSDGKIALNPGDTKTVTITNEDNIPKEKPVPALDFSYGYINGYDTGNVGPEDSLTREQVSASLYRIFKQAGKTKGYTKPEVSDFTDLNTDRWSFAALEYMVSVGAIPRGTTVNPMEAVTRGEMAKIIAVSNEMTNTDSILKFPDLPESHPYYDYLNMLVNQGLLKGYPDGTINPDGLITRAEYVTLVNRFIGRDNRYDVSGYPSLYKDLLPTHWAFTEMQRASFGFSPIADNSGVFHVDPDQGISKAALDN